MVSKFIDGQLKNINVESIDISKTIERKEYLISTLDKAIKAKADKTTEITEYSGTRDSNIWRSKHQKP